MIKTKDSIVIGSGYWGENIMKVLNKKKDFTELLRQI